MDYLQYMLNTVGGRFKRSNLLYNVSDKVYPIHILTILNGGHTNQTTTFVWSLVHALRSPFLSALRKQKTEDLLEATFRETSRLYTNLILLRRITIPQKIMGHHIPKGVFIAVSPLVTARDPKLFPYPDEFHPERWLTPTNKLDDNKVKGVQRSGASTQFGKGQHACKGEELGRLMVKMYWKLILEDPGFDLEIVSGVKDGVGVNNVGVEPAWTEANLGTPFERGGPLLVRFNKRT